MEKFTNFRDASSGIQPFLHPQPPRASTTNIASLLESYILGPILLVLRLLLLIITALLYTFTLGLGLMGLRFIGRPFENIKDRILMRMALWSLGFYYISATTKLVSINLKKTADEYSRKIVLSNHSSYLDIVYLKSRYSPIFLQTCLDGKVLERSWLDMINGTSNLVPFHGVYTLTEYIQKTPINVKLVIFPEATSSNGRSFLAPFPLFGGVNTTILDVDVVVISYSWSKWCPTYTTGSKFGHLLKLMMQTSNTMEIKIATKQLSSDKIDDDLKKEWTSMSRLQIITKNASDKNDFLKFFNASSI